MKKTLAKAKRRDVLGLDDVPRQYKRCALYTDFWKAYTKVLPAEQHWVRGKKAGQTNPVEGFNNTLRQQLGRFVRQTLSFSKTDEMHEIYLLLFLHDYNKRIQDKIRHDA